MSPTHDHPLPGDLVIRVLSDAPSRTSRRYFLCEYPRIERLASAPSSLPAIMQSAKRLAQKRGGALQVWREESSEPIRFTKVNV